MLRSLKIMAGCLFVFTASVGHCIEPEWLVSSSAYRILVEVPAVEIGDRDFDALPASLELDFTSPQFASLNLPGHIDLDSLVVMRYEPATGKSLPAPPWPFARAEGERASRFLDKSLPWHFPISDVPLLPEATSATFPRGAYLVNAKGKGNPGLLVWDHAQDGHDSSHYAIYFDTLEDGQEQKIPRQGFIGDGSPRRDIKDAPLTGSLYNRLTVDDWDGDGLTDLIVGVGFGNILHFRNQGDRNAAKFGVGEYLVDSTGRILDAGGMATPDIADWNGDDTLDLVVSWESADCLIWYENVGTNMNRKLVYRGSIRADDQNIVVPAKPNPEAPHYTRDYAPSVEVVDWDGDGDIDLLLGGYITGYIWYYENTGNGADGTPTLTFRGPIKADGKPIDTIWGAHPCAADFDNDGDLDLLTGSFGQTMGGGDYASKFLIYYENIGTRKKPIFTEKPVSYEGTPPVDLLAQPRPMDFNHDGLMDLVISTFRHVYLAENVGTKNRPTWNVERQQATWGLSPLSATQFMDWDGDGDPDAIRSPLDGSGGPEVLLNEGKGTHGVFMQPQPLLPKGQEISHPAPYGDPWAFVYLHDFDGDTDLDILWADGPGHAYLHRNNGTKETPDFDTVGEQLRTSAGEPIKVGPPTVAVEEIKDFTAMQGSRAGITATDFDQDGDTDIAMGDTYGDIFYFVNMGTNKNPIFADAVKLGNIGPRAKPLAYDWDRDGHIDLLGIAWSGQMEWYRNLGPGADLRFEAGQKLNLPPSVMYSPRLVIVDWNADGDDDCMIMSSYPWFCWLESSYIKHGYVKGKIVAVESHVLSETKSAKQAR